MRADARPQALLALAPAPVTIAYLQSPALLFSRLWGQMLDPRHSLQMLLRSKPPAFLAPALPAHVNLLLMSTDTNDQWVRVCIGKYSAALHEVGHVSSRRRGLDLMDFHPGEVLPLTLCCQPLTLGKLNGRLSLAVTPSPSGEVIKSQYSGPKMQISRSGAAWPGCSKNGNVILSSCKLHVRCALFTAQHIARHNISAWNIPAKSSRQQGAHGADYGAIEPVQRIVDRACQACG